MNPTYDRKMFYALRELYRESILADGEPPWNDEGYPPPAENEGAVLGSIRTLEQSGNLICYLVVEQKDNGLWLAQQLSMFTEFCTGEDLILKAHGGAYLALAENCFLLDERDIWDSVEVDRVGLFDLLAAQEFCRAPARAGGESYWIFGLPNEVRHSFVISEFELSCELRSRHLPDSGVLALPKLYAGYFHGSEVVMYLRNVAFTPLLDRDEISKTRFFELSPESISGIRGAEDSYEIEFEPRVVGRRAELWLEELLVFRGDLPSRIKLKLPFQIALSEMFAQLRVRLD